MDGAVARRTLLTLLGVSTVLLVTALIGVVVSAPFDVRRTATSQDAAIYFAATCLAPGLVAITVFRLRTSAWGLLGLTAAAAVLFALPPANAVYDANLLDMPPSAMGVAVIFVLFDVVLALAGLGLLFAPRYLARRP